MKVTIKIRFNASSSRFESFGNNRYLAYLLSDNKDGDAMDEIKELISRKLGVPHNKIQYLGKNQNGDAIFET